MNSLTWGNCDFSRPDSEGNWPGAASYCLQVLGPSWGRVEESSFRRPVVALEVEGGPAPCVVDTPATCTAEDTHDIHIMPRGLVTETRFRVGDDRCLA